MFFKLPGRKAIVDGGFPVQPRKLRQWLGNLPLADMGDTSRQFFEGLRHLNAGDLAPTRRLELLEMMRPMAGMVLEHLNRHFINRTLPLSEKARRIEELYRMLLTELASGYTRVVNDLVESDRVGEEELALAIHRAMHYLSEGIVNSWRLYEPVPPGGWLGVSKLYRVAETHGVQELAVPDASGRSQRSSKVSRIFKRLCLVSLTHPLSLRRGETDRVAEFLDSVTESAVISADPMPDSKDGVYVIDLDGDDGPGYHKAAEVPQEPSTRTINLSPLARDIRERLQSGDKPTGMELSTDLLRRILDGWTRTSKRRFSRAARDDEINVSIGLASIHSTISSELEEQAGPTEVAPRIDHLSLQSIGDDLRTSNGRDTSFLSPTDTLRDAEAWDIVGRGNVITHAFTGHSPRPATVTTVGLGTRAEVDGPWQLVNASAGGFCLRWVGGQTCRAQVGELIGLREKEGNHYQWRVGMIRWMLNRENRGLEIGVQILAPKTMLVTLSPSRLGREVGDPVDALLLPAIKTIQQPPTLLVAPGRFRVGDEAMVRLSGRTMRIKLAGMDEHTSLFVQYRYTTLGKGAQEAGSEAPASGADNRPHGDGWPLP